MKKKAKVFTVGVITLLLAITTVYAAATASGSFSLTYGKSSQTEKIKTEASYPYMKYTSNSSDVDAIVQVTLSKSSLFSLENKQRLFDIPIDKELGSISYALFSKYSPANYIATTVESAKDGIANAEYLFSSKSSAGIP